MRHLGWLIAFVAGLAVMWWAGLRGIAVLLTLVCGLAGLAYLACALSVHLFGPNRNETRATSSETYPPRST